MSAHGTNSRYTAGCRCSDCRTAHAENALAWRQGQPGYRPMPPPLAAGDGDPRHGTVNGYSNHACRCDDCVSAWRDYCSDLRKRREPLAADDPRHGTDNGYRNFGCRCAECRTAATEARARYRKQVSS